MCDKYEELKGIYQREEISSKSLSDSHKDISSRLLKAVRLLIDEKVARQNEKCRFEVVSEEINKMKAEKETLETKIRTLKTECNAFRAQYDELKTEKIELEKAYEQCKTLYENVMNKSTTTEQVPLY